MKGSRGDSRGCDAGGERENCAKQVKNDGELRDCANRGSGKKGRADVASSSSLFEK